VFDYIEMFYNPVRKHATNGMLSPVEFERQRILKTEGVQKSRGYSVCIAKRWRIGLPRYPGNGAVDCYYLENGAMLTLLINNGCGLIFAVDEILKFNNVINSK
jgi:hypothetical protein